MENRTRAIRKAHLLMKAAPLFLDTETTGLDDYAEICEIAVLDAAGNVLIDTLVRPLDLIPPEASAIHGITNKMVARAPTFPEVLQHLLGFLYGRTVIIYNLDYDWRLLWQSADAHGIEAGIEEGSWHCAMKLYADYHGQWNDYWGNYKWQKLGNAGLQCGLELPEGLHRARADAELARRVVLYMSEAKR